ncbi:MAG: hypothetical protein ACXVDI_26825, partial [Ktedonobacterales bacterium]
MIRWRHEHERARARLARGTAATRLGAETTGLEAAGHRRRALRLHLEQLPGYAPELNPDEGIW